MNKAIVGIVMMLVCIVGVNATTYHIGDEVTFETSIKPYCGEGECTGPTECAWIPEGSCIEEIGCVWVEPEITCDLDLSDNEGLFIYGGFALKDSDGIVRFQENPSEQCVNPYIASTSFIVDKVGTWKFCSRMYALEVNYDDLSCSNELMDCDMDSCQEILVEEECHKDDAEVYTDFTTWLGSW